MAIALVCCLEKKSRAKALNSQQLRPYLSIYLPGWAESVSPPKTID